MKPNDPNNQNIVSYKPSFANAPIQKPVKHTTVPTIPNVNHYRGGFLLPSTVR